MQIMWQPAIIRRASEVAKRMEAARRLTGVITDNPAIMRRRSDTSGKSVEKKGSYFIAQSENLFKFAMQYFFGNIAI